MVKKEWGISISAGDWTKIKKFYAQLQEEFDPLFSSLIGQIALSYDLKDFQQPEDLEKVIHFLENHQFKDTKLIRDYRHFKQNVDEKIDKAIQEIVSIDEFISVIGQNSNLKTQKLLQQFLLIDEKEAGIELSNLVKEKKERVVTST